MTRKHIHEESFPVAPDRLFAILCTPSAIRQWWNASRAIVIAKPGGLWVATWGENEDQPDFITSARIQAYDPPRRLVLDQYSYVAKTGPLPFNADFVTEFSVSSHADGALLRVTQDGFPSDPSADSFFAACQHGWKETFQGIRRFLAPL